MHRRPRPRLVAIVTALAFALVAATSSAAGAAPKISGADTDVWNVAAPTPAYTITGSARGTALSWTLSGSNKKGTGTSPLRVSLTGLTTATYTLQATETGVGGTGRRVVRVDVTPPTISIREPTADAAYLPGQPVVVDYSCGGAVSCAGTVADGALLPTTAGGPATFTVTATDSGRNVVVQNVAYTVGPVAPTITARPAQRAKGNRAVFAWSGGEPGAVFTWQVLSAGMVVSQGDTIVPTVSIGPLMPGAYAFQVRQVVGAARIGPYSVADPFAVVDTATSNVRSAPTVRTPSRLHPRAGASITRSAPLLTWRRVPRASLYNLQVFRVRGTSLTKVSSVFPRGNRARAGGLRFGRRYAWRVWPYVRGSGYTPQPLGLSYFDLVRPVRLDAAQMLVDRRIAQAAVRRVNAIEQWLDAGVTAGDLRHASLGALAFDPALQVTGAASADGTAAASVRAIGTGGPGPKRRARVRVRASELLATQRIAQSAVRRIDAIEARLAAGLTGGDIVDGSIGLEKLAAGVTIGAPTIAPVAVPRTVSVTARPRRRAGRVRLTSAQLLVSQRISQGAVRRAEALRRRLVWGFSTDDFRQGSITAADLEPALRR